MEQISLKELLESCKALFSPDINITFDFFRSLQPEGLKSAFREKAKENHPDKACARGVPPEKAASEFLRVKRAFERIEPYVREKGKLDNLVRSLRKEVVRSPGRPVARMRFGMFLCRTGRITIKDLTQAMAWQRKERPAMGALAMEWRFLSPQDVSWVLKSRAPGEAFGEAALRLKKLTGYQVLALLGRQAAFNRRLGGYFVEKGVMSEAELSSALREFMLHNLGGTT